MEYDDMRVWVGMSGYLLFQNTLKKILQIDFGKNSTKVLQTVVFDKNEARFDDGVQFTDDELMGGLK
jgi:hypothetical protein